MATLKAADTFVGGMFGLIGGSLLTGAYMANKSNTLILETGRLAEVQTKKLEEAKRTADHYKYLCKANTVCLEHLESENKKLKKEAEDSWHNLIVSSLVAGVGYTVVHAIMK